MDAASDNFLSDSTFSRQQNLAIRPCRIADLLLEKSRRYGCSNQSLTGHGNSLG
jgi:hypothetical protein